MNGWMVNVFVEDSTYGLVTAALLHRWASYFRASIHVCFTDNGDCSV